MIDLGGLDLASLLATYGYWVVLLFVAVESMGIPVPGETMLLTASIYAGTTHRLSLTLVVVAAATGAIVGDNIGFLVGREGGYRVLRRYGTYVRLNEERLRLGQYLFQKHGGTMVFWGRFLPVLRIWAAFLAGANRMAWRRFLTFNAAGGIVWASIMGGTAYTLGSTILRLGGVISLGGIALAMLLMASVTLVVRRNERRLQEEANSVFRDLAAVAA
jgi:membrane protein DedA with SNARE-associated domain